MCKDLNTITVVDKQQSDRQLSKMDLEKLDFITLKMQGKKPLPKTP